MSFPTDPVAGPEQPEPINVEPEAPEYRVALEPPGPRASEENAPVVTEAATAAESADPSVLAGDAQVTGGEMRRFPAFLGPDIEPDEVSVSESADPQEVLDEADPLGEPSETALQTEPPRPTGGVEDGDFEAGDHGDEAPASISTPQVSVQVKRNAGTVIGMLVQAAVKMLASAELPGPWVEQQLAAYVPAPNRDAAEKVLQDRRVLVLVAEEGMGRCTTGLHLLLNLPEHKLSLKRVQREPGESFAMAGVPDEQGVGWLLDLRAEGDSVPVSSGFGLELNKQEVLESRNSYLVVLIGPDLWGKVGAGAADLAVPLRVPAAGAVLSSHLGLLDGSIDAERWLQDPRITEAVLGLPPGQVQEWAQAISRQEVLRRTTRGEGTDEAQQFRDHVGKVIEARASWRERLRGWHTAPGRTSGHRNHLLTRAVFDGEAVPNLHLRVDSLAKALGEEPERRSGQQGPGIIELTWEMGAELMPDGSVRFPGPGFPGAVVEYFWADRPYLVDEFTRWTVGQSVELKHPIGTRLADRVAPWILHHSRTTRTTQLLQSVVTRWSAKPELKHQAKDLLAAACLDPRIGRLTRDRILKWAGATDTVPELKILMAAVCQDLTPVYPKEMLLRLARLAQSTEPKVSDAVGQAINELWNRDDLRQKVYETIRAWARDSGSSTRRSADSAFLYLADRRGPSGLPTLLEDLPSTDEDDVSWVVGCWRTVLENRKPTVITHKAFETWMDAALAMPEARDMILDVFVQAVHATTSDAFRAVRLLAVARLLGPWEGSDPEQESTERNRVRELLSFRLNEADPFNVRGRTRVATE